MSLFDIPVPEPSVKLSYGAQLTQHARNMIAAGRHPANGSPVRPGVTRGDCSHLVFRGDSQRRFYKCAGHRLGVSRSAASDIRVSWPGCALFENGTT